MAVPELIYEAPADAAGVTLAVSIYADRADMQDSLSRAAGSAGLRVGVAGPVTQLLDGDIAPLGDLVVLECPAIEARTMAALARLDMRIERAGAQLVVLTTMESLDSVFACLDRSDAKILVDPTPGEITVALGRELPLLSASRVRELSDDDRLALLRLSEQVDAIAQKLDGFGVPEEGGQSAFRLESPVHAFRSDDEAGLAIKKPKLPDPKLVRRHIRERQARAQFFDADLFADPAWDMLLDLTAARGERSKVSVTSLCIASGVPATTALRWIRQMIDMGLFERVEDHADKRRAFIALSDKAADAMARYFAEIAAGA